MLGVTDKFENIPPVGVENSWLVPFWGSRAMASRRQTQTQFRGQRRYGD